MKITSLLAAMAALLATSLAAMPARAQLARTFVSAAVGNDASDCNRLTPCRSFQGAHDKTLPDGEITVLDAGGYGAVTITKSISIVNDGVGEAGILVSGGATGVTINAPAGAHVSLRGITVQGIGFGGGDGLKFNSGAALSIANCVFRRHSGLGILFAPTIGGASFLSVQNTLSADNGSFGVQIIPLVDAANVRAVIDRVHALNNGQIGIGVDGGFTAGGSVDATITNSIAANSAWGFFVTSFNGKSPTNVTLLRSVAIGNSIDGVEGANAPLARVRMGEMVLTGNQSGWNNIGGIVESFGDNYIAGNVLFDSRAVPTIVRK